MCPTRRFNLGSGGKVYCFRVWYREQGRRRKREKREEQGTRRREKGRTREEKGERRRTKWMRGKRERELKEEEERRAGKRTVIEKRTACRCENPKPDRELWNLGDECKAPTSLLFLSPGRL